MKKRLTALLCAAALCLALALPVSGAAPTVYLLAADNKFCDLPGGVLPTAVNGVVYVPYTLFDKTYTGVDLGVYYGISQERDTILTLYSLSGNLVFNVKRGLCTDGQGNTMDFHALIRSGIPYVPASAVCSFFGLNYSFLPTADRGTLIRITNPTSNHLSDSRFLDAATSAMTSRYNNVLQSLAPQPTPSPTPAPTPTPVPQPTPSQGADAKEDKSSVGVYLAVDASASDSDLTVLFPEGVHALFLFTPDSLTARAPQVRKAVAAGHSVGLLVQGTQEEVLDQLERGNDLLAHIARVRTRLISAPAELTGELSQLGWSCWQPNVTGTTASAILSGLDGKRTQGKVALPAVATVISRVLRQIREDGYTLHQPLETDL